MNSWMENGRSSWFLRFCSVGSLSLTQEMNWLREIHIHLLDKCWCCKWWTRIKISSLFSLCINTSIFWLFLGKTMLEGWLPDCLPVWLEHPFFPLCVSAFLWMFSEHLARNHAKDGQKSSELSHQCYFCVWQMWSIYAIHYFVHNL